MALTKKIFWYLSKIAVLKSVHENEEMSNAWNSSLELFPNLSDHYATDKLSGESLSRIRMLICAQAVFMTRVVRSLIDEGTNIKTYADIGDSDGTTRMLFQKNIGISELSTIGINIQPEAVEQIRSRGLDAECMDAMKMSEKGLKYDVASIFETLEHLPDPIGFLRAMQDVVSERLIISVPLIVRSRVGLGYLKGNWPKSKRATIANNHIFELAPEDWNKLFLHTGWRVDVSWQIRQFPRMGLLHMIMKFAWRKISFEGFYFVSLVRDDKYSSRYIEG